MSEKASLGKMYRVKGAEKSRVEIVGVRWDDCNCLIGEYLYETGSGLYDYYEDSRLGYFEPSDLEEISKDELDEERDL